MLVALAYYVCIKIENVTILQTPSQIFPTLNSELYTNKRKGYTFYCPIVWCITLPSLVLLLVSSLLCIALTVMSKRECNIHVRVKKEGA